MAALAQSSDLTPRFQSKGSPSQDPLHAFVLYRGIGSCAFHALNQNEGWLYYGSSFPISRTERAIVSR